MRILLIIFLLPFLINAAGFEFHSDGILNHNKNIGFLNLLGVPAQVVSDYMNNMRMMDEFDLGCFFFSCWISFSITVLTIYLFQIVD